MSSPDLAARVMEVTGSTRQVALNLLAACANDVQAAVDLYLANEEITDTAVPSVVDCPNDDEETVRAPIAPIREQLVGPEDDNFRQVINAASGSSSKSRSLPRIKVCPLRDFAREGSIMEENLSSTDVSPPNNSTNNERPERARTAHTARSIPRTVTSIAGLNSSAGRLGDLFRPPTDITAVGSFQYVRARATNMKRWLLANVQSDNFNSQLLNRDVWSAQDVRNLIKKHFILWQVAIDTPEGSRFSTFYRCKDIPYVCVIDPRTGEEVWKNEQPNNPNFLETLKTFITKNSSVDFFKYDLTKDGPSTSSKNAQTSSVSLKAKVSTNNRKRKQASSATELSEEEQLLMAVRNSLKENGNKKTRLSQDSNESDYLEISDSDDEVQTVPTEGKMHSEPALNSKNDAKHIADEIDPETYKTYLGVATDEMTTLKIRVVNADIDESLLICWPSDTRLRALKLYISERFPTVREKFKLISPFPRKVVDLSEDGDMQTLKDANLHPSSTLHVHLDD